MKAPIAAVATVNGIFCNNDKIVLALTVRPQAEEANKLVGNYKVTALSGGKVVEAERPRTLRVEYTGDADIASGQSVGLVLTDLKQPSAGAKYADGKGLITGIGGGLADLFNQASLVAADPKTLEDLSSAEVGGSAEEDDDAPAF